MERTQIVICALIAFVLAGLAFRAVATGAFKLPVRERIRVPTVQTSVALWFVWMAIFPWRAIF
jgi:hypothetical protein